MLYVTGVSGSSGCGTATVSADPVLRILTITVPACVGTLQKGIFETLQGEMLIGPRVVSTLSVDSVAYSSPFIQSAGCANKLILTADTLCTFGLALSSGANTLSQNFPNPINSDAQMVTINYQIVADTRVLLRVFNILGEEVTRLVDADQLHGQYSVGFNVHDLPNGEYYYTLDAGIFHSARNLVVIR